MSKPKAKAVTVSFSCEFPNYKDMWGFDLSNISDEEFYKAVREFKSFAGIDSESKFRTFMTYFWLNPQERSEALCYPSPFEIKKNHHNA